MRAQLLRSQAPVETSPLELADVAAPEPGPGEVRVRVTACGVCRTDLHVVEGDLPPRRRPVVPGHQVVGVVDRLGPGCLDVAVGDRVGFGWLRATDGSCEHCRAGRENLCPASRYTGYHADGGYAEMAVVPEAFAYALPAAFDDVGVTPLLCGGFIGYRALERADVPAGGRLLLVGFGSSAHVVLQLAAARGHEVSVLTRSASHVEHARSLGAAWAGSEPAELPQRAHAAILFAPSGALVPICLEALEPGGTLAIAGIHLSEVPPLTYERHLFHEKQVRSVEANTREDARRLLAEAAEAGVRTTVTRYALADANQALQDVKHSRVDGTAVLVTDAAR